MRVGGRLAGTVVRERRLRLARDRDERGHILFMHRAVERVGRGNGADEYQHDEAHALLAVVAAVEETHATASEDQQAANPERWRCIAHGLLVERGDLDGRLEYGEQQEGRA